MFSFLYFMNFSFVVLSLEPHCEIHRASWCPQPACCLLLAPGPFLISFQICQETLFVCLCNCANWFP